MNKILSQVFSGEYANQKATGNNFILWIMYRFAYPFAVLLNKLHLSPNQITTISTALAIFAFIALVREDGWILFSIFWGSSVLLDFCDGTVARMTNKFSKNIFRYDHMSDLFKISLMFVGAGLRYDNDLVWTISSSVLFLFMYLMVLNHDLNNARKLAEKNVSRTKYNAEIPITQKEPAPVAKHRLRDRYRIVAWAVKYTFLLQIFRLALGGYRGLHTVLTTINGHTLFLFFLVPLGPEFTVWSFSYLGLVLLAGIRRFTIALLAIKKP